MSTCTGGLGGGEGVGVKSERTAATVAPSASDEFSFISTTNKIGGEQVAKISAMQSKIRFSRC